MKKIILILGGILLGSLPAVGADLQLKARPAPASLWDTGGWYVGIESGAAVANTQVSGSNSLFINGFASGNIHADGGYIGGVAGYMRGSAAGWYGAECDGTYRNISAGDGTAGVAANVASKWAAGCDVRYGGTVDPLSLVANALNAVGGGGLSFPTFNPVPPPGAHVAAAPRTYAALGFEVFGIDGNIGIAGGSTAGIAPRIKIGALWQQLSSSGTPTGGVFDVDGKIVWASKGLQFTNVFDPTTGAKFSGTTNMGNLYAIELSYKFAPGGLSIATK